MSKENNIFDEIIKSKLEQNVPPFNESSWDKLEQKLPSNAPTPFYKNGWLFGGAAAVLAVIAISVGVSQFGKKDNSENDNGKTAIETSTDTKNISANEDVEITSENKNSNAELNEVKETELPQTEEEKEIAKVFEKAEEPEHSVVTDVKEDKKEVSSDDTKNIVESDNGEGIDKDKTVDIKETDEKKIVETAIEKPVAKFSLSNTSVCMNGEVMFTSETQPDVEYLWNFGDGHYSKEKNPTHTYNHSGSYEVNLIVRSAKDENILTKSTAKTIEVHALPEVDFTYDEDIVNGMPLTTFNNYTYNASAYLWKIGKLDVVESKEATFSFKKKGTYPVTLQATNAEGCTSELTKYISVKENYNLFAPNAFSPNGDGINDYFIPEALQLIDGEFTMNIYSQKDGGLVFTSSNYSEQWDGTDTYGQVNLLENYVWVVKLTNSEGEVEHYEGVVLVAKD